MGFMDTLKKWFGSAKENVGDVADKAGDMAGDAFDKAKDMGGDAMDKAKDVAGDIKDKFDGDDDEPKAEGGGEG